LPDHVRTLLEQRMKLGPFRRPLAALPAHITRPNADALVSVLAGAQPSASNAAPQSCRSDGTPCSPTIQPKCCGFCGSHGCCSKPFRSMYCTSNVQCCSGACFNHRCL
jgi:hypothetical protein